jgi:hypothetical protein
MRKQTWQHVPLLPPAKIATPRFGSDVAARSDRATLRAAVLQAPDVALKMSTALEGFLPSEQGMRLAHAISKATSAHSSIRFPNPHNTTRIDAKICQKSTWQHVPLPPAKIATPTFGSDVAARSARPTLRTAVLQAPDVALKMSTTLERPLLAAQGMRLAHAISKETSAHSSIRFPNPHKSNSQRYENQHGNTVSRTSTTSEDRDSEIRQRCGCKISSSCAESCSAPRGALVLSRVCCDNIAGEHH